MHYFSDLFNVVLYMFRTGTLSIITSISTLYTLNSYLSSLGLLASATRLNGTSWSCSQAVSKTCMTYIPLLCVQWKNSWWWTEELSETCRVLFQNKFEKLVHLVGFIIRTVTLCLTGYLLGVHYVVWGTNTLHCTAQYLKVRWRA